MWGLKKKWIITIVAMVMVLCMLPFTEVQAATNRNTNANTSIAKKQTLNLIAGQNQLVGTVTIEKVDQRNLRATYELNSKAIKDGWLIYEAHLAVGKQLSDIPQTKGNKWGTNAIPGHFPYNRYYRDGVQRLIIERIDISRYSNSTNLYIAAHAVIKKKNPEVIKAPYSGTKIYDYSQGLDYNGNKIIEVRSNPENGLYFETGMNEQNFYSLGFSNVDMDTGWIIIEFGYPITNGKGDDLEVIEDTWISHTMLSKQKFLLVMMESVG